MNQDTLLNSLKEFHFDYNDTTEFGDYTVRIEQDDMDESPREWDNMGTMVCFHNRYNLGDKHEYADEDMFFWQLSGLYPDEYPEFLTKEQMNRCRDTAFAKNIILPLYLYDHSGITMSTTGFACGWDSGMVGWIYMSHEKARTEYCVKRVSKKLRACIEKHLTAEVQTYDQFLTGEVYYFNVEKTESGEHVDSCGGYYGYNDDYMISVIKDAIRGDIADTPQQTELQI